MMRMRGCLRLNQFRHQNRWGFIYYEAVTPNPNVVDRYYNDRCQVKCKEDSVLCWFLGDTAYRSVKVVDVVRFAFLCHLGCEGVR